MSMPDSKGFLFKTISGICLRSLFSNRKISKEYTSFFGEALFVGENKDQMLQYWEIKEYLWTHHI